MGTNKSYPYSKLQMHLAISIRGTTIEPESTYPVEPFTLGVKASLEWYQEADYWYIPEFAEAISLMKRTPGLTWKQAWRKYRCYQNQTAEREANNPKLNLDPDPYYPIIKPDCSPSGEPC